MSMTETEGFNNQHVMREKIKRKNHFFVYIVQCKSGTYYTGYTNNLKNRIKEHNSGKGARYTRDRRPVKLVWCKEYRYFKLALKKEKALKCLTHRQKQELIRIYGQTKQNYIRQPPQISQPSASKSKRGGHLTSKCQSVYIRTFGCQMVALLCDCCSNFK